MIQLALACSFLSLVLSFITIAFVLATFGRLHELHRAEFDDPTNYRVVTDGQFYRVRGPFDTFYTIRFHDPEDARRYAEQLASWHRHLEQSNEGKWRAVA